MQRFWCTAADSRDADLFTVPTWTLDGYLQHGGGSCNGHLGHGLCSRSGLKCELG